MCCHAREITSSFSGNILQPTGGKREEWEVIRTLSPRVLKNTASSYTHLFGPHQVFPAEKVGAAGDHFDAKVYETDPTQPIGNIKEAWESAKRRSHRLCPN